MARIPNQVISMIFDVNVPAVPADIQIDMANLQCEADLKNTFGHSYFLDFYKLHLSTNKFGALSDYARRERSPLGHMHIF